MVETRTIVESLYYLLKKLGPTDKVKLVKLLYFADKYHLIKYGRTITNDEYWAMPHGPVGSNAKDVLEFNEFTMSKNECDFAKTLIAQAGEKSFKVKENVDVFSFDFLSESDMEALNFVIKNFGTMDTWKIRDYSHKYPEWAQYEDLFKKEETRRERIRAEELISVIANDPFQFSDEQVKEAKSHFLKP